ncbi:MAG: signal transduction histidine kinase [Gammaproteobacteria bacterium]|jgi:signal transduction histidine kinase
MKPDQTRALQTGFLFLLAIAAAQAAWWVFENAHHAKATAARLEQLYVDSATTITAALSGADAAAIDRALDHIKFAPNTRIALVDPDAIDAIRNEAQRRTNRFYWEGGFFLLVLIVAMFGLAATIRRDRQLARRQQNFLASVSHEFKSPLASIQLTAETLNRRSGDEETKRWGTRILVDCERLLRTVENLLNTNRLDEGSHNLIPETIRLSEVFSSLRDEFEERMQHYEITFTTEVEETISLHIDAISFETIVRNLVDNALKACIAGDGKSVALRAMLTDAQIVMSVSDSGIGFEASEKSLLFEKFYRVGDEQRRTTPGTGLGLYIVKRLANLSGASVLADSEGPGRGATITLKWDKARK